MRQFALLTMAAWVLVLGGAQAKVVSSSIETGEYPFPSVDAIFERPVHGAMLEVRASPRAPVEVVRDIRCVAKRRRHQKRWITVESFPSRIRMPVLIHRPSYCGFSALAYYKSRDQNGRIALRIRYQPERRSPQAVTAAAAGTRSRDSRYSSSF